MTAAAEKYNQTGVVALRDQTGPKQPTSLMALGWRRFRAHRMAIVGAIILLLIVLYVVLGSFAFTEAYANDLNLRHKWEAPSSEHLMGTDAI